MKNPKHSCPLDAPVIVDTDFGKCDQELIKQTLQPGGVTRPYVHQLIWGEPVVYPESEYAFKARIAEAHAIVSSVTNRFASGLLDLIRLKCTPPQHVMRRRMNQFNRRKL